MKTMYSSVAIVLLVIAVSTMRVSTSMSGSNVYSDCTSLRYSNGVQFDCDNRGLTVIPTDFPDDTFRM